MMNPSPLYLSRLGREGNGEDLSEDYVLIFFWTKHFIFYLASLASHSCTAAIA